MLDLAVRDASHGQASLREVMRWMNANYAKKGRFFNESEGVREAAEAVSHADLSGFLQICRRDRGNSMGRFFSLGWFAGGGPFPNTVADAGFTASRNFDGPMAVAP